MATDTIADVSVDLKSADGKNTGKVSLAGPVFGIKPNTAVMHQVVTAQLAAGRAGTHSTKTRAEVRGGGAKPWRQKGTGRARQGSIRSPHWVGGGVAHGPKPRDYSQRTPKKMVKLALRSALSDRAADGKVIVVDGWNFDVPKTKSAKAALDALEIPSNRRALVVLDRDDEVAYKSFRNLDGERRVHVIEASQLNAYEVLVADWIIFTSATLDAVTERLAGAPKGSEATADLAPAASAVDADPSGADTADAADAGGDAE